MTGPDPDTSAAWIALIRTGRILLDRIEAELKRAGLPPLGWYDALWEVERAGTEGLRPFELQERLLLPQYSMSRLLDRLERAGLIRRVPCDDDGRGQLVVPTDAGLEMRGRMWPVYRGFLESAVQNRLSTEDRRRLARLLSRLAAEDA